MQRHHNGSGRRVAIPSDWSAHHRPVLAGTRTATVTLRRPGGTQGAFDPVAGTYAFTPNAPYYAGPGRVQILSNSETDRLTGEQQVSTLGYAVTLDHTLEGTEVTTAVQIDDLCQVTALDDNGDPTLIGRDMVVEAVERGSLHWERRILVTDNLENLDS